MRVQEIIKSHKEFFLTQNTKDYNFRIIALNQLDHMIRSNEEKIMNALKLDLGKSNFESYATEIGYTLESIKYTKKHLKKWMKDKKAKLPIHQVGAKAYIKSEPYGVALIIGPFNYPFQLLIEPMIGAIAAGNTVILKPSEYTVHTSNLIEKMIEETFLSKYITVCQGDKSVTSQLVKSEVDYIFFTGSVPVGKIIMREASSRLTPLTLELGGKSPTIVHHDANISVAANRIAWGKFMNAGQTCIAPDYILVHDTVEEQLKEELSKSLESFYTKQPKNSNDYGRIINEKHFDRLVGLINHEKVFYGGDYDREQLYISPTIQEKTSLNDPIMQEEIFGPILPILTYSNEKEMYETIRSFEKPLALYIFSEDSSFYNEIVTNLPFGGGCINDTLSHITTPELPFGGVGSSGIGKYHGKASFLAFSHQKSMVKKTTKVSIKSIFPPYKGKLKLIKKIMS